MLAECKVNRVSLGVQSFEDSELAVLGRIHTAEQASSAVETLRRAGIENISLDLIYGIPGQTERSWRHSLEQALGMDIQHLSCYALSFEPDTPLGKELAAGKIAEMDEDLQKELYYSAIATAENAGLEHYEISNFAQRGFQCIHNLTYWHNESYLGIGPSAASYISGVRKTNQPNLQAYLDAVLSSKTAPADSESLSGRALMAETLMLGLRMIQGIDRHNFTSRFGIDAACAFPMSFNRYNQLGFLEISENKIRLDKSALFVANTILADILAEV